MTADQYTELIEFLARKFEAIDRRFEAIEHRLTKLEVSHEAMRDDIRALAEGQIVINARLDRFEAETRERFEALEARMDRFEVETGQRFDALEHRMDRLGGRFDRLEDETRQRFDRFEDETGQRFDGLEVRFDRFEVDFGTVLLDHGRRIEALEHQEEGA